MKKARVKFLLALFLPLSVLVARCLGGCIQLTCGGSGRGRSGSRGQVAALPPSCLNIIYIFLATWKERFVFWNIKNEETNERASIYDVF